MGINIPFNGGFHHNYQSQNEKILVAYYRLYPPHLRLRLVFLLITGLLDYNTKLTGRPAGL